MASAGFPAGLLRRRAGFRRDASFRELVFVAADVRDFFGFFERVFFPAGFFATRDFAVPEVPILRDI